MFITFLTWTVLFCNMEGVNWLVLTVLFISHSLSLHLVLCRFELHSQLYLGGVIPGLPWILCYIAYCISWIIKKENTWKRDSKKFVRFSCCFKYCSLGYCSIACALSSFLTSNKIYFTLQYSAFVFILKVRFHRHIFCESARVGMGTCCTTKRNVTLKNSNNFCTVGAYLKETALRFRIRIN